MELLLHYVWQQRLFPLTPFRTDGGELVDVIDVGLRNTNAGPDFFNAKIKIGNTVWVGNVEIHVASSDWYKHRHHEDMAYDSIILHIAEKIDMNVTTVTGKQIPQIQLPIPQSLKQNYDNLCLEKNVPPCKGVLADIPLLTKHAWLNHLTAERLEEKTTRIQSYLHRTNHDWEYTFFITLARSFGFGLNAQAFEDLAFRIPPSAIGKHRNNLLQVEAFFFGQAGFLNNEKLLPERQDEYFCQLRKEYLFLQNKFSLLPMDVSLWKFLRLRPQNFPHIRLAQLAFLYHREQINFSRLTSAATATNLIKLLSTQVSPYWETHFKFGVKGGTGKKTLQKKTLQLLLINTVAPILFLYGKMSKKEELCERACNLLEQLPAEKNHLILLWQQAGITPEHAADSQALIQLSHNYCEKKDCLRCKFGAYYLKKTSL